MTDERYRLFKEGFWADAQGADSDVEAFLTAFSRGLFEIEAISDDIEPAHFEHERPGKSTLEVDGYVDSNRALFLFIVDKRLSTRADDAEEKLGKTDLQALVRRLYAFLQECRNDWFKRNAREFDETLSFWGLVESLSPINPLRFEKIVLCVLTSRNAEAGSRQYDVKLPEAIENVPLELQIWDLHRLHEIKESALGRQPVTVDFSDVGPGGLPCLEAPVANEGNAARSWLAIIPGAVLAALYDKYGARLLEGNVRSFLSFRGAVNKAIRNTINNHPARFFTLNNGIAVTVCEPEFRQDRGQTLLVGAKDFQVINGGQTTAALANTKRESRRPLSDDIFVPMKITEVSMDSEKTNELIREISHASNNQNKVNDADFFSIHPFHRMLEQIAQECITPSTPERPWQTWWFYERTRGQYEQRKNKNTRKRELETFQRKFPKEQIITKTDLAKFWNTWEGLPHIVSKGAGTNFAAYSKQLLERIARHDREKDVWTALPEDCNDAFYKRTVGIAILFRALEKGISSASWYCHSYRANLVTYSLALFARYCPRLEEHDADFDLLRVWDAQKASPALLEDLLGIAEHVQTMLLESDWSQQNITQVCKQEKTWDRMCRELGGRLDLHPTRYREFFMDATTIRQGKQAATQRGELLVGLKAVEEVMQFGKDYWRRLAEFADERMDMGSFEAAALREAKKTGYVRNERYAQALLRLRQRACGSGFIEHP